MKSIKYILLLTICCFNSAFATLPPINTLTCPASYPANPPQNASSFGTNYFQVFSGNYNPQPNTLAVSIINVNASSSQQALTLAANIASSGLVAYSSQPSLTPSGIPYCTYHSSTYPLPNESPQQAVDTSSNAAFVTFMVWGTTK